MQEQHHEAGANAPAFQTVDLSVRYGSVIAVANISASFEAGKIHAVVGQNGAGKTTFARVAAGLVRPSEGKLSIFGEMLEGGDVSLARACGVELVHQSFALPPSFTIAEVLQFVGPQAGLFSRRSIEKRWQVWLDKLGLGLSASARIRDLPIELQQSAEIARAMVSNAKLLILDEPTAVLSPEGIDRLFGRVRELKSQGVTVMLVLHKIREVLAIADTVTVLRGGKLVAGPLLTSSLTSTDLATLIIGETADNLNEDDRAALTGAATAISGHSQMHQKVEPILQLQGATTARTAAGAGLTAVNLTIHKGEILGIAGVEGNGQRDLVACIAGLEPLTAGSVLIGKDNMTVADLATRKAAGLRIIPFERNVEGLSLTSPLWENWCASGLIAGSLLSSVRPASLRAQAKDAFTRWDVRFDNPDQPAGSLSGGNAQKVILAREIDASAKLILAAQPTRGLDIGATASVWQALRGARDQGAGVMLVSSDLDELFDICDRVVVMASGRAVGVFCPPYDLASIGLAMTNADLSASEGTAP